MVCLYNFNWVLSDRLPLKLVIKWEEDVPDLICLLEFDEEIEKMIKTKRYVESRKDL